MVSNGCDGCGEPASSFQCPLCQAEAVPNRGFFCSQECFAKNWLAHRGTFHKSGVARVRQPHVKEETEDRSETGTKTTPTAGRKRAANEETKEQSDKKRRLRRDAQTGGHANASDALLVEPWFPLPSASALRLEGAARVTPPLQPGTTPRAVIGRCARCSYATVAFWSAAVAAAHHIAAEFTHEAAKRTNAASDVDVASMCVLIVAPSAVAAHAMAWAIRSVGLAAAMKLVLAREEMDEKEEWDGEDSTRHFSGERRIVIATPHVVGRSAASWIPTGNGLLVTLPGVPSATDLQAVHTRALFFVYSTVSGKASSSTPSFPHATEEAWCGEETIAHYVTPLSVVPAALHEAIPVESDMRFDNEVATAFARGELSAAVQHLVRLYSTRRGHFEEFLSNSLVAALGAASVAHMHHTLAYIARQLVDHSARFTGPPGASLKEMALRALFKVVRLFPSITQNKEDGKKDTNKSRKGKSTTHSDETKMKAAELGESTNTPTPTFPPPTAMERQRFFNYYDALPNLQLQATLCYIYPDATPGVTDALAEAWGVRKILPGPDALQRVNLKRADAVHRVQSRYGSKLGPATGRYMTILMHFLYDAVVNYSLSVEEVERRTLWSLTMAAEAGPLHTFLANCFLLQDDDNNDNGNDRNKQKKKKNEKKTKEGQPSNVTQTNTNEGSAALSSRQVTTKHCTREQWLRALHPVRTAKSEEPPQLPWVELPLSGTRERNQARLRKQAVEEILMAMPRKPHPMYVGEVGNLIGKWLHFNARFDGALGGSLMEFLIQHPDSFKVVDNLVTRRTAGTAEQVKMRFDDDSGDEKDEDSDSDKESRQRKARDRLLLTGAKGKKGEKAAKEIPARARKKAMIKAFNKANFNRNYKPIDPSAKVPGYVKHGLRKVKGRGRKANKRNTKRG